MQRAPSAPADAVVARRDGAFDVHESVYAPGTVFSRHHHERPSLFVVLSGRVDDGVTGSPAECVRGWAGFIPPGVEHRSEFGAAPVHSINVVLDGAWLERSGLAGAARTGAVYRYEARVAVGAHRLLAACRASGACDALGAEELVLALLGGVVEPGARAGRADAGAWLRRVVDVLHEGPESRLDLRWIAAEVGRNPAHVSRAFRAAFGCSMSEYARMVRVERAVTLLRSTGRALCNVALDSGFSDQAHMTRVFAELVGQTPGACRRGRSRGELPRK